MDNLLDNNLANIKSTTDLFGGVHKKLSMSDRIGFLPISIWRPDWSIVKRLKDIIGDSGEVRFIDEEKSSNFRQGGQSDGVKVGTKISYLSSLGGKNNNVSIFNPHLAQMILSAYCPEQANIFDPFGGGGTRGFIASAMGHTYTGIEIRQEEVDRIKKQQKELQNEFNVICADCRNYEIEPESFNFSYTCPPYYNLEVYSKLRGDISNADTYDEFLNGIRESLKITYSGLKPESLCVWVVGNFRGNNGSLTHFNGDVARIGQETGFKLWDELIFWGASGSASQRAGNFEANRKSVRVHEYILIFKK